MGDTENSQETTNSEECGDRADLTAKAEEMPQDAEVQAKKTESPLTDENLAKILRLLEEIRDETLEQPSIRQVLVDLRNEVRKQSADSLLRAQKAVLVEMIMLHDNIQGTMEWLRRGEQISMERMLERLETIDIELLEILARREVRPFDGHPLVLDHRLHRTINITPTMQESENNQITKVVRTGFWMGEAVLRPEEVVIKKYTGGNSKEENDDGK
jgi:molecular chaperone GrpE (heat shock protein)